MSAALEELATCGRQKVVGRYGGIAREPIEQLETSGDVA
jgi:hypothetical protein